MKKVTEKVGMFTRGSVLKGTGRDWDQWLSVLDKAGARGWSHQEMVAFLRKKHKLSMWWQQGVAAGYQIMIGLRVPGRNLKGQYSVTVTKTMPVNDKTLWKILSSPEGIAAWLKPLSPVKIKAKQTFETEDGAFGEIRTMLAGRRVRLSWHESDLEKNSIVQIYLIKRPGPKSLLAFTHENLVDGRRREPLRARWRGACDALLALAGESN